MTDFSTQFVALLPALLITATIVAVVLATAIQRHHFAIATITVVGLNASLLSLLAVLTVAPIEVTPLFVIDDYSVVFIAIILVAALACSTLAYAYLSTLPDRREEYYILLLCSTLGSIALVSSQHMASLFIGFELVSVPLYGMVAYAYRDRISLEGGLKYLILSGVASSFLLFGMALLYAASGTLSFAGLLKPMAQDGALHSWLIIGVGMMVVGLGFKLSLVPFHLWTPDVYEGAPGPVSAFLATVSKVAMFGVLMRFFVIAPTTHDHWLLTLIGVIAFASMLIGNLLALRQNNIKRLLGYSSIAHMGYLLTAVVAGGALGVETVGVYLITYVATTLGAFGVVTLVSSPYSGTDAGSLQHYRGLFWRRPYLAAVLTVMMLSLAGIPITIGFIGKFYAIAVAVQSGLWWLVGAVIVGSAIGLFYYLRIIAAMCNPVAGAVPGGGAIPNGETLPLSPTSGAISLALAALTVLLVWLGIYPEPLIRLLQATIAHLG